MGLVGGAHQPELDRVLLHFFNVKVGNRWVDEYIDQLEFEELGDLSLLFAYSNSIFRRRLCYNLYQTGRHAKAHVFNSASDPPLPAPLGRPSN